MKRVLLILLLVIIVAGIVGTLAAKDPGYVLLHYDGATLQMGLWLFLASIIGAVFGLWLIQRLFRWLFGSAARIQNWRKERQIGKSMRHTNKGLMLLQEGNAQRATKFLFSGIKHQPYPAVNYLHLAEASDNLGESEDREKYLRLAEEADDSAKPAVAMLRAELSLKRKEWATCLTALESAPTTNRALLLKRDALVGQKNWLGIADIMPQLRKSLNAAELKPLEKSMLMASLAEPGATDDKLLSLFRAASEAIKSDPEVITALCERLSVEKELEAILRKSIKQSWQPELVETYAELGKDTAQKRLKTATGWQKQHPVDASLSYCIGYLNEQLGNKDEAISAYQTAIELGSHRGASRQLANLFAFDGDHQKSNEYLNLAYRG